MRMAAVQMLSPGVYINEIDWSAYVAQASSSIVGLVISARRGPTTPTLITDQKSFISMYGNPVTSDYGGYCAYEVLSQADQVYIARALVKSSGAIAGSTSSDKLIYTMINTGTKYNGYKLIQTVTSEDNFSIELSRDLTDSEIEEYKAQFTDQGDYDSSLGYVVNDLVKSGTTQYVCIKEVPTPTGAPIDLTDEEYWKEYTDPTTKILETYTGLSLDTTSDNFVINKINGISDYFTVALLPTGELTSKTLVFDGAQNGAVYGTAGTNTTPFKIKTKYYDSTLNYCVVKFTEPDDFGYFMMVLYQPDQSTVIEVVKDLTLDPDDDHFVEKIVAASSNNIEVTYNADSENRISDHTYVIMGGQDGASAVTSTEIVNSLELFSNPETFDINLLAAPGWYDQAVVSKGIEVAENRADCMFITGTPAGLTPQDAINYANASDNFISRKALNSSYCAVYWPWVQVHDNFKNDANARIWLPPEGDVLAQFAYSDSVSWPWFAPAGLNRGIMTRVLAVEYNATKGERDALYGNRNVVNPIISYKNNGIVIWGQKTTQRKASALDRINVRRLMIYLEKIISASTDYFVFDPNDKTSWTRWKDMVDPKLENIKKLRGMTDYKTIMSPTTDELENNTMPGTIYIKPTKAAEYIPLNFVLTTQNYDFEMIDDSTINS